MPPISLAGFFPPVTPFKTPLAIPFRSGTNFGSAVVPWIKKGIASAFILKSSALLGLTVPAPVTVANEGTTRSILSAPAGTTSSGAPWYNFEFGAW